MVDRIPAAAVFPTLLCLVLASCVSAPQSPIVDIRFTTDGFDDDLSVTAVTARAAQKSVMFRIAYRSEKNRWVSLFSPPRGYGFQVGQEAPAGDHTVSFIITRASLVEVRTITAQFSTPQGRESGRVFLNSAEVAALLERVVATSTPATTSAPAPSSEPARESPAGPPVVVRFTTGDLAADLTVARVTAQPGATTVTFAGEYSSGVDRVLSFFDPPNGSVFKHLRGAPAGSGTTRDTILKTDLKRVCQFTLIFSNPGNVDSSAVFLEFADIAPLLE